MKQLMNPKRWSLLILLFIFLFVNSLAAQTEPTPEPDVPDSGKPVYEGGLPVLNSVFVTTSSDEEVSARTAVAAPVVDFWYENSLQFGQNGNPQQWVNIMGNASGPPYNKIDLEYRLNGVGGFKDISIDDGSDKRRLGAKGDFNIELDIDDLLDGLNTVEVRATNTDTNQSLIYPVTFTYDAGNAPNENVTIDWSEASSLHAVAQPVDGQWTINSDGTVGPNNLSSGDPELHYDRLLAIGDMGWVDYEVTVPLTIHGIDSDQGFNHPSNGPGVGLIFRWRGHYDEDGEQPNTGWRQIGALGWFRWSTETMAGLEMIGWSFPKSNYPGGGNVIGVVNENVAPQIGVEYIMKMRVETVTEGDQYSFKVWPASGSEPLEWNMEGLVDDAAAFNSGSLALVSHHVDVSFGDVRVQPLDAIHYTLTTNTPANGSLSMDPEQEEYLIGSEVELTAVPDIGYKFAGWGGDESGIVNPITITMNKNQNITATFVPIDEEGATLYLPFLNR